MRYAGALSAGIITNCRSSFDCAAASILIRGTGALFRKTIVGNHVLLDGEQNDSRGEAKLIASERGREKEKREGKKGERDASHNLLI